MKISKLSVIIFIFLLLVTLAPPATGSDSIESSQSDQSSGLSTDQYLPTDDGRSQINASVSSYQRNVTVQRDAKVAIEDDFTLKVLDNTTKINRLNYSLPSAYAKYIHRADFFTQFGDDVGLDNENNSRKYTVFFGKDVTTFSIDIREDGFGANDSIEGVFVKININAFGSVNISSFSTGQRGDVMLPVTPMFPNIRVEHATVGIGISGSRDQIVRSEVERYTNALGNEVPRFTDAQNVITYLNMSRDPFSYKEGLQDGDVTKISFRSETPLDLSQETSDDISTVVPSVIDQANRTVRFDPWGKVYVTETISVRHLGAPRNQTDQVFLNIHQIPAFTINLDRDAQITDVYDELGSLELGKGERDEDTNYPLGTASSSPGKQALSVTFRNPIYGGQSYEFTVEYHYNASEVISIDEDTKEYTWNTTLFSDYNTTVWDMKVRYQFPAGSSYISNTYDANSRFIDYRVYSAVERNPMSSFSHLEMVIEASNASYVDNIGFQIKFRYNGLGHIQYLATYFYITVAILAFAYALSNISYRPSKAVEIEKEQIPVDLMDNFFNLFSEKVGAEKRLQELRKQRSKRKISKKDYDGKVKAIKRRLRDLNPQLEKAANKLSAQGGRYDNYVKRVMLASQRQNDIRRNAREAKRSYQKGAIPKNIYQLRIKEFNEDLKRQESVINKTLTEMVEVIQKFNQ